MANGDTNIRVLVDWDNDRFMTVGGTDTMPLNLITSAPHYYGIQNRGLSDPSAIDPTVALTDYGLAEWVYATDPLSATDGIIFGSAAASQIPVSSNTEYTAVVWVKKSNITVDKDIKLNVQEFTSGGVSSGSSTTTNSTVSTDWVKVTHTFTTSGTTARLRWRIITTLNSDLTIHTTGFMLVTGSTPEAFNVGDASNRYDDVTRYLSSARWQLGNSDGNRFMFDEGSANVVLHNNESNKIFSPEHTSSPLLGKMLANRRVYIYLEHPTTNTYQKMFSGFITDYSLTGGTAKANTTTLGITQGRFKFQEQSIVWNKLYEDTRVGVILQDLMTEAAWIDAGSQTGARLDLDRIDNDAYVASDVFNIATTTGFELDEVGREWAAQSSIQIGKRVQELLDIDHGYLLCNREGKLEFRDYTSLAGETADYTLNIGSNAESLSYVYGKSIFNQVTLDYQDKIVFDGNGTAGNKLLFVNVSRDNAGQPVLALPGQTIAVGNSATFSQQLEIDTDAGEESFEYGVIEYPAPTIVWDLPPSQLDNNETFIYMTNNTTGNVVTVAEMVLLSNFTFDLGLTPEGRAIITINNVGYTDPVTAYVLTISVSGKLYMTKQQYIKQDPVTGNTNSIAVNGGVYDRRISTDILSNETEAEAIADRYLDTYKAAYGEYQSFNQTNRDDTYLTRQMDYSIGTILDLQDGHLLNTNHLHMVVGESYSWIPTLLKSTFYLTDIERYTV